MSKSKDIGTRAETAVVRFLRAHGFPQAERRALAGVHDLGDIIGTVGICWEVKARNRPVTDGQINAWLAETETERINSGADIGVLVVRRPGVGEANAGRWWTAMRLDQLGEIVAWSLAKTLGEQAGPFSLLDPAPVRMLLADAVQLIRTAGYGDPIEAGGADA
ncbi:hypothetical protein [Actinomadura sp. DC4]|uniref:hypothetical protein n=1 Tax=Actinomadura sp. DC4 TaxID=3055069 RepID=UPI0025AF1A3E|nr:hypothetical protein [Actinomadura sp. DC4]MDN3356041.1 hypothetical protein [Actinomadura sp. DC4]